ncbi:MAG: AbrB/MazE/SpoVT family DNA-binding domain-containing protein [Oscillospiraceae bacterium]|nr:AbrB/MazE/SpoVT family DNA-binding domain-containing protein [Oscillospiraceae bacterium]
METTLQLAAWGGSTALRIPKNILQRLNLNEKSTVKVRIDNDEIIIKPVYPHKTLKERFEGWVGNYELTDEDREWLNLEPMGEEV